MSAPTETAARPATAGVAGGVRVFAALGTGWGVLLMAAAPRVWLALTGRRPNDLDRVLVQVLGARHLAQGLWQAAAPTCGRRLFVTVELVHATSMVVLATADGSRRRPALVFAAVALASATASATATGVLRGAGPCTGTLRSTS